MGATKGAIYLGNEKYTCILINGVEAPTRRISTPIFLFITPLSWLKKVDFSTSEKSLELLF